MILCVENFSFPEETTEAFVFDVDDVEEEVQGRSFEGHFEKFKAVEEELFEVELEQEETDLLVEAHVVEILSAGSWETSDIIGLKKDSDREERLEWHVSNSEEETSAGLDEKYVLVGHEEELEKSVFSSITTKIWSSRSTLSWTSLFPICISPEERWLINSRERLLGFPSQE